MVRAPTGGAEIASARRFSLAGSAGFSALSLSGAGRPRLQEVLQAARSMGQAAEHLGGDPQAFPAGQAGDVVDQRARV